MDRTIVTDRIAEFVENGSFSDSHIFRDFEQAEYARQVGRSSGLITQLVNAAKVAYLIKPFSQLNGLQDKTQHLAAIHARRIPRSGDGG